MQMFYFLNITFCNGVSKNQVLQADSVPRPGGVNFGLPGPEVISKRGLGAEPHKNF